MQPLHFTVLKTNTLEGRCKQTSPNRFGKGVQTHILFCCCPC